MDGKLTSSLLIIFLITSFLLVNTFQIEAYEPNEPIIDQSLMLLRYDEDISSIKTKVIIDNNEKYHYFIQTSYWNSTFLILHIVNDQIIEVDKDISRGEVFQAYLSENGVRLVYSMSGGFYGTIVRMYSWTEETSDNFIIFSTIESYIPIFIQNEEESIHLLSSLYFSQYNGTIIHIRAFDNQSIVEEEYTTPYVSYTVRAITIINQTIFTLHDVENEESEGNYYQELQLLGLNENGYYNSTSIRLSDYRFFQTRLSVGKDFQFRLSLYESFSGELLSKKFSVNESVSLSSFNSISVGYSYIDVLEVFSYENYTYYVVLKFEEYYEIQADSYYNVNIPQLVIIKDDFDSLDSYSIDLVNAEQVNYFYSVSSYILENDSYVVSYASVIDVKDYSEYRFRQRNVVSLNILSDLPVDIPSFPYLLNLKNFSAFTYFWIRYWTAIIIPILVLGFVYLIFHKRINYSLQKLRAYLLRPIIEGASKTKLIFINIWLFITNASSLIFSLWKANKRRLIISLLGLTILASIVVTSTSLFDSKRNSLIVNHVEGADLRNDGHISILFDFDLSPESINSTINENITQTALSEILIKLRTSTNIFSRAIRGSHHALYSSVTGYNFSIFAEYTSYLGYLGYTQNYSSVIQSILVEGTTPNKLSEVVISSSVADTFGINLQDTITINASSSFDAGPIDSVDFTVVGLYNPPSLSVLRNLCKEYNVSFDPIQPLTSFDNIVCPTDFYLKNFENVTSYDLDLFGRIQLLYDFSGITIEEISTLLDEIDKLQDDSPFNFSFDSRSTWIVMNEIYYVFNDITATLQTTQFLMIFLSIPIVYLAWFLIFEVNELFGASFAQEIRILRSKGVSTGNISFIYTSMKLIESIIATGLGFVVTLLLLPPLLRVERFVSFTSESVVLNFASLPIAMSITFIFLVLVSLPRIIKQSRTKKQIEKPPRRLVQLLRRFRLHYFFIVLFGASIAGISLWMFQLFGVEVISSGNSILLMVFVYLMGIGVMITLLGVGLILKELHKLIMIVLSKVSWLSRKSIFSFSLVEIRSDINLFNNTFLTYLILIGIILPFIVTPIGIQNKFTTAAYFYEGSDLYITSWNHKNQSIMNDIALYGEVESVTNITVYHCLYGDEYVFHVFVINDLDSFLSTVQKPPEYLVSDWEYNIGLLRKTESIYVSSIFFLLLAQERHTFTFYEDDNGSISEHNFLINGVFDYFPIFYDEGPPSRMQQSYSEFSMVTTSDNFLILNKTMPIVGYSYDRLLIKTTHQTNPIKFSTQLEYDLNIDVEVTEEAYESFLNSYIPYYSLVVAEFIFGILICIAAVVFTSISNPMKILQRRITKHDVLKKIGIPTNSIIFLSALELFISCILPGLLMGALAGYGLLKLLNFILLGFGDLSLPYVMPFPYVIVLILFLGIPIIFYAIFFLAMKWNFARYMPRNLE